MTERDSVSGGDRHRDTGDFSTTNRANVDSMRGRATLGVALIAAVLAATVIAIPTVSAELENSIFTSNVHRIRLVVPRGWRPTDQPSYPGLLLWMLRNQPEGKIVLTAEPFTRAVYCSWPIECRQSADALPAKLACALRDKLTAQRMRVGPPQAGPKENAQNGMPSVWFELDDGKRYLRQAVALGEDRVVSLTLQATSLEARSVHVRAFEQALRTLRPLTPAELGVPGPSPEQVIAQLVDDGGVAGIVPSDPGASDAAVAVVATSFESAPESKQEPVGPCGR
jgi:hypothetical protein